MNLQPAHGQGELRSRLLFREPPQSTLSIAKILGYYEFLLGSCQVLVVLNKELNRTRANSSEVLCFLKVEKEVKSTECRAGHREREHSGSQVHGHLYIPV